MDGDAGMHRLLEGMRLEHAIIMYRSAQTLLSRWLNQRASSTSSTTPTATSPSSSMSMIDPAAIAALQSHLRLLNGVITPTSPTATVPPVVVTRHSPLREPIHHPTTSPVVSKAPRRFSIGDSNNINGGGPSSSRSALPAAATITNGHGYHASSHMRSSSSMASIAAHHHHTPPTPDLIRSVSDGLPPTTAASSAIHRSQSVNGTRGSSLTVNHTHTQPRATYVPNPPVHSPPIANNGITRSPPVAIASSSSPSLRASAANNQSFTPSPPRSSPHVNGVLSSSPLHRPSLPATDQLSPSTPPTVSTTSSLDLQRIRRLALANSNNNSNGSNSSPPTTSHVPTAK